MISPIFSSGKEYISASRASKKIGYSSDYIGQLCRAKKIPGQLVGRTWYIELAVLLEYKKNRKIKNKIEREAEYVSALEASKRIGYSSDYIGQLCRAKKIPGQLVGRTWYVDFSSLLEHRRDKKLKSKLEDGPIKNLKIKDAVLIYSKEELPLFPQLSKSQSALIGSKVHSQHVLKKTLALALSLVMAASITLSLFHESPSLAGKESQLAAVSIMDFFTDGWNSLKQIALGESKALTTNNLQPTTNIQPTTNDQQPTTESIALTETTPALNLDSVRNGLKSELESYINARLSSIESPIVVYSSSPVIKEVETIRQEILLADTRPTVTRQSTSDVDALSRAVSRLTDGGVFANASLSGSVSGTGGFSILEWTNATGTNATTTALYVSGLASTTNLRANSSIFGDILIGLGTLTNLLANGSSTLQNFSAQTGTLANLLVNGSSTLQNFTASNSTTTNATTTNLSIVGNGAGLLFTGTGNHDITTTGGTLRIGANTVIGNILALDDTIDIGTAGTRFDKVYANEVNATTLVGTLTGGNLTAETFTINSDNTTADTEDSYLSFERGSTVPNALLRWDSTNDQFDFQQRVVVTGGNLGVGTTSPYAKLSVTGTVTDTNSALFAVSSTTGGTSTSTHFTILNTGNIGIATTSPSYKFSVSGSGFFDGGTIYTSALTATSSITTPLLTSTNLLLNGSTTLQNFTFTNATGTSATTTNFFATTASSTNLFSSVLTVGNNALVVNSSGNVGINTTPGSEKLTISGNIGFSNGPKINDSSGKLQLQVGGTGTGSSGTGSIYFLDSSGSTKGRVEVTSSATVSPNAGLGFDGAVTINGGGTKNCQTTAFISNRSSAGDCVATAISSTSNTGQAVVTVGSTTGFLPNDEVLLIQMTGTGAGSYEFRKVLTIDSATQITLTANLTNTYTNDGTSKPQMVRVPNYTTVLVTADTTFTVSAWNGTIGGIMSFRAKTSVTINSGSLIDLNGLGFTGGSGTNKGTGGNGASGGGLNGSAGSSGTAGTVGNGPTTTTGGGNGGSVGGNPGSGGNGTVNNSPGGGGAGGTGGGGAGGAYATANAGSAGTSGAGGAGGDNLGANQTNGGTGSAGAGGTAATTYGTAALTTMFLGSGGGQGGGGNGGGGGGSTPGSSDGAVGNGGDGGNGGAGGAGGGIIFIETATLTNSGTIRANGAVGSAGVVGAAGATGGTEIKGGGGGGAGGAPGGGGSGGSINIQTTTITEGTITASGGAGSSTGGNGGNGGNPGSGGTDGGGGGGTGTTGGTKGTLGFANGASAAPGAGATGGNGRIRCDSAAGTGCSTTPTANENVYGASVGNSYGTLYIGAVNTTSADLAEYYPTHDQTIVAGEVVSVKLVNRSYGLVKAREPDAPLGIISTNPALILGGGEGEKYNERLVALSGRVPVKVSNENGAIEVGDRLAISTSTPGYVIKATKAGDIVAIALEPFSSESIATTSPEIIATTSKPLIQTEVAYGTILAFVSRGYWAPELTSTLENLFNFNVATTTRATTTINLTSLSFTERFFENLLTLLTEWFRNTANGIEEVISDTFRAKESLCINDTCVTEDQLKALLVQIGGTSSSTPDILEAANNNGTTSSTSTIDPSTVSTSTESVVIEPSSTTTPDTLPAAPEPTPEPTLEPPPDPASPDPVPELTPEPTPESPLESILDPVPLIEQTEPTAEPLPETALPAGE
ncbi:MAG: hypothetical protein AAB641_01220 [Patescibacteria group bacterium]